MHESFHELMCKKLVQYPDGRHYAAELKYQVGKLLVNQDATDKHQPNQPQDWAAMGGQYYQEEGWKKNTWTEALCNAPLKK